MRMYRQLKLTVLKETMADIVKSIGIDLFLVVSLFILSGLVAEATNLDVKTAFSCLLILGMFFRLFQR